MKKQILTLFLLILSLSVFTGCKEKESNILNDTSKETVIQSESSLETDDAPESSEDEMEEMKEDEVIESTEKDEIKNEFNESEDDYEMDDWFSFEGSMDSENSFDFDFGKDAKYSGLYRITGYSSIGFDSTTNVSLYLSGKGNEYSGEINVTKTDIPTYITKFIDYIYIDLVFDNSGIVSWKAIDKTTNEFIDLSDEDELIKRFQPEKQFECVESGTLPEIMSISEFPAGKTYVFDIVKDDNDSYYPPEIINDSDSNLFIVCRGTEIDDMNENFVANISMRGFHFSAGWGSAEKYYVAIKECPLDYFLYNADYVELSEYSVGDTINFDFEDFIYNDTDKVITLVCGMDEYILNPNDVAECSWTDDIIIKSIK